MMWATAGLLALSAALPLVVMVDKPVAIVVAVPEQVRNAKAVLLRMEGVVMHRNAPATWNVFWGIPDDVHLLGYVSVPANQALRDPKPANFTLQLSESALAALHRDKTMRFTFVPVRKLPDGGVTINSVRLE